MPPLPDHLRNRGFGPGFSYQGPSFESLQLAGFYRDWEYTHPPPDAPPDSFAYRSWREDRYQAGRRFTRNYWNEKRELQGKPPLRSYSPPHTKSPPLFEGFDPLYGDDDSSDSD